MNAIIKKIGSEVMNLSRRSFALIIANIYATTLLFANNYFCTLIGLKSLENYIIVVLPILLIVSLSIELMESKKINFSKTSLYISIAFLIWSIITIFIGIHVSLFSLKALIHISIIISLSLLLYNIGIDKEQFNKIKMHLFIVLGVVVLIGLFEYIFNIGLTNKIDSMKYIGIKGRVISTYHIATVLDKYIIMIMVILSYELIRRKNYILSALFIVSSIALALTFTRAGIIAFIALSIFFIATSIWQKKYINFLIILISVISMFLIPGYKYAFQSAADYICKALKVPAFLQITVIDREKMKEEDIPDITEDESIKYRDYYQFVGTTLIKEYPISGIGIGNYPYLYNNQNVNDYLINKIDLPEKYMYPHNGFIQTTAELGIIGIILYAIFFISFVLKKIKKKNLLFLYPCILLLFFFFLGTITEGLFTTKQYMYIFIIVYPLYCNYMLKEKIEK